MNAKVCTKCGETKPLSDYYVKRERGRERYASHCKPCHLQITNDWQARNRTKVRALHRSYDAERDRHGDSDKARIYSAVQSAIKSGLLIRPTICDECGLAPGNGHDGRALIEAHHEDYGQPLDVRWLCSACHKRTHARG